MHAMQSSRLQSVPYLLYCTEYCSRLRLRYKRRTARTSPIVPRPEICASLANSSRRAQQQVQQQQNARKRYTKDMRLSGNRLGLTALSHCRRVVVAPYRLSLVVLCTFCSAPPAYDATGRLRPKAAAEPPLEEPSKYIGSQL